MELKVIDAKGQVSGSLAVSDALFAREYNEALVHQLVTAFLANARIGSRSQLTRAEVKHSTKKPWRQKGTDRARSGMTSSPLWRSGGRAFPNKPNENFTQKVNRKMYRAGMAAITLNEGCQLDEQDLRQMLVEFKKAMPAYAVPVFLRIQKQMQTTGTFKYQKNTLKTQGFDLKQCDEKILVLLPNQSAYCELTQEIYNNIQQYQYRF